MNILGYSEQSLLEKTGYWTAREINQQPGSWQKTQDLLLADVDRIGAFLSECMAFPNLRIILTGAGTSAFIGECLAPELLKFMNARVEAIATTDLVSGPHLYFQEEQPTLLVSFGRSGNSPESIAAMDLAEKYIRNIRHLVITCNSEGALHQRCKSNSVACAVLLPDETHDRSFAMTSSFSSMFLAAYSIFTGIKEFSEFLPLLAQATEMQLQHSVPRIKQLSESGFKRVVYLGSNGYKGLAREAALKLMEMTDGEVVAVHDSPLGFRHGPKTIVDKTTLLVIFVSNHVLTRKYDIDLYNELKADDEAGALLLVSAENADSTPDQQVLSIAGLSAVSDPLLVLPYVLLAQIYAFECALNLGYRPDSPSVSGTVNRVVEGVVIHA